ncbi:hypothetical protein SprV_0501958300 [Sparganum proliferum]
MHEHKLAVRRLDPKSEVATYAAQMGHIFNFDAVEIVGRGGDHTTRRVQEAWMSTDRSVNRHINLPPPYLTLRTFLAGDSHGAGQSGPSVISAADGGDSGTDAKQLHEMRLSFPSGHSAYSMFPAIFICLYLYYRMPRIGVGSVLQAFVQITAFSLAFYVGLSRVSDYKHHWSDVLAGMLLGAAVAIFTLAFASDVNEFESFESYADERELVPLVQPRPKSSAS